MTRRKKALVGMIAGGVLAVLGPLAGVLATALSLNGAFAAVKAGAVAPEDKARHLAEGISSAMNMTAAGIALAVVGLVVLVVSAVVYARARPQ
jgi:ABC-type antimicrobial peptide transport system permease subunit